MTLQTTSFGPTKTSPSAQAFVTDPLGQGVNGPAYSMGPGYPVVGPVCGNVSLPVIGPPCTTLTNIEASTNVTATLTAVYSNSEAGNCPQIGPGPFVNGLSYRGSFPWGGSWQGASFIGTIAGGGPNANTPTAPSPATSSNETEGETGTEQFLASKMVVDGPQQGAAALNAPNPFAGVLPANSVAAYRWE